MNSMTRIISRALIASLLVFIAASSDSGDLSIDIEMIVTYLVNDEGLITSINAYWDLNAVAEQLGG